MKQGHKAGVGWGGVGERETKRESEALFAPEGFIFTLLT